MAGESLANGANGHADQAKDTKVPTKNSYAVKVGLAQMLKGGVIMDVVDVEQARIAEEAGAVAGRCEGPAQIFEVFLSLMCWGGLSILSDDASAFGDPNLVSFVARVGLLCKHSKTAYLC